MQIFLLQRAWLAVDMSATVGKLHDDSILDTAIVHTQIADIIEIHRKIQLQYYERYKPPLPARARVHNDLLMRNVL